MDWHSLEFEDAVLPVGIARRARRSQPGTLRCANCDLWFPQPPARAAVPYCSMRCKGEAKAVRYARAKLVQHGVRQIRALPSDLGDAAKMKIAHAIGGGYDDSARRVPAGTKRAIWERDSSTCTQCGAPATQIDHIAGPSSDPSNLRLLCSACHTAVTSSHFRSVEPGTAEAAKALELLGRIAAARPKRACDGMDWAATWRDWCAANGRRDYCGPAAS